MARNVLVFTLNADDLILNGPGGADVDFRAAADVQGHIKLHSFATFAQR